MKSWLVLALAALLFSACTAKYGIQNAKAYVRKSVAGTIRVDDNGRPRESGVREEPMIFFETDAARETPVLSEAWVNQRPFSVKLYQRSPLPEPIGRTASGQPVQLETKGNNQLWEVLLTPKTPDASQDPALAEKIRQNAVVLIGQWKNKAFTYTIPTAEALQITFNQ